MPRLRKKGAWKPLSGPFGIYENKNARYYAMKKGDVTIEVPEFELGDFYKKSWRPARSGSGGMPWPPKQRRKRN